MSVGPPAVQMTAAPLAMASSTGRLKPSARYGAMYTSAACINAATSANGSDCPEYSTDNADDASSAAAGRYSSTKAREVYKPSWPLSTRRSDGDGDGRA